MSVFKAGIACCLVLLPVCVGAQTFAPTESQKPTLHGKHRIEIGVGFLSEVSASNEVSLHGVTTQSNSDGVLGSLAYTHYPVRDFGIRVNVGVLDADAKVSVIGLETHVESASVVHVLLGVKYQPSRFTIGDALKPYASASIGPYIGSVSNVLAGMTTSTEAFTETTFGSRVGLGMDVFFARVLTLGVGAGYHFVSDFDRRIGSEDNYSGPEFSMSFGVAFGG